MPKPSHAHHPPPPPLRHPHQLLPPSSHPITLLHLLATHTSTPPPSSHHPPPPPLHPHQHPPPPSHQPYQHPPTPPRPPKPRRTTLAPCIVTTVFLIFIIILLFILYFSLFKPKDPKITITAVRIPTFTVSTNSTALSFTFSQYTAIHNPNRAVFSHFDCTLQLLYTGNRVGFMFIPAGNISAGKTEYMSATFSVQSFLIMGPETEGNVPAMVLPPVIDGLDRVQPTMELEMVGRVRVLWFFSHRVESVADCRVTVTINDGSVPDFHC